MLVSEMEKKPEIASNAINAMNRVESGIVSKMRSLEEEGKI